jgi:glycosyltransferase involved in cell wall biosynthesis
MKLPFSRDPERLPEKPLVSVITIFFNAEKFMEQAIESVISQTYDNWEYLLVDDGSTDNSTQIAKRYCALYPQKFFYVEHEGHQNRGMSATRNLGMRHSKGKYIAFLDTDDIWLKNKLERQVTIMEVYPEASMICGATRYWYSWSGLLEDSSRDYIPDLGIECDKLYQPPSLSKLFYPLGKGVSPCPSDLLLRTEIVEPIGGFEEHFRGPNQFYEDQAFLAKLYLQYPVFVSGETWDQYRIHPDSCSSQVASSGNYQSVRNYFLNWFQSYLTNHGLEETDVWNLLQQSIGQQPNAEVNESVEKKEWPNMRRVTPISIYWGFDRGLPIDRYYVEKFLQSNASDIQGCVLEIGDDAYTRKYGGDRVSSREVLNVMEGIPQTTYVADLARGEQIPSNRFDCIILTQTLQLIYDTRAALRTLHRILKPEGVLLATFPGISKITQSEWPDSWFWCFTTASARKLFAEAFGSTNIQIEAFGNVLSGISFLQGLASEELDREELDYRDPDYEVLIAARSVKVPQIP